VLNQGTCFLCWSHDGVTKHACMNGASGGTEGRCIIYPERSCLSPCDLTELPRDIFSRGRVHLV
jgi:hypothetical protein